MNLDFIDKKVAELLQTSNGKKKIKQGQQSKVFVKEIKTEVSKLKECILKYTQSTTVKDSIYIQGNTDGSFTITFNDRATKESIFSDYPVSAYIPLLRNEGYQVKNPRWRAFFGTGSKGKAEHFIEKGIKEYQRKYGDNLSIEVIKKFSINYSQYNETIDEIVYY